VEFPPLRLNHGPRLKDDQLVGRGEIDGRTGVALLVGCVRVGWVVWWCNDPWRAHILHHDSVRERAVDRSLDGGRGIGPGREPPAVSVRDFFAARVHTPCAPRLDFLCCAVRALQNVLVLPSARGTPQDRSAAAANAAGIAAYPLAMVVMWARSHEDSRARWRLAIASGASGGGHDR
jgi:hypothetical protein